MIWFGNLNRILPQPDPAAFGPLPERARMLRALKWVAERAPHLTGSSLLDALAGTGWVDRGHRASDSCRSSATSTPTATSPIPSAGSPFAADPPPRSSAAASGCVMEEVTGDGDDGRGGTGAGDPLPHRGSARGSSSPTPRCPSPSRAGRATAVEAAVEEMPDVLVVVARNFERSTAAQLAAVLERTEVPGHAGDA